MFVWSQRVGSWDVLNVVAQFGLQIFLFTWSAACNSNSAPPKFLTSCNPLTLSPLPALPLLVFRVRLNFCGCYWLEVHHRGRQHNESEKGGGKTREPRQFWHVWPEANCGFMRWELRPGHRWINQIWESLYVLTLTQTSQHVSDVLEAEK